MIALTVFASPGRKSVRLFLRADGGERSRIVLKGVEAINLSDLRHGNIIFDIIVVDSEKLTIGDTDQLYNYEPTEAQAEQHFRKVQQQRLSSTSLRHTVLSAQCFSGSGNIAKLPLA